jgi:hypothetical protein
MGVRLYNPAAGRFLSTDPIAGGNANAYDYCVGDPMNCRDNSGKFRVVNHGIHRGRHIWGYTIYAKFTVYLKNSDVIKIAQWGMQSTVVGLIAGVICAILEPCGAVAASILAAAFGIFAVMAAYDGIWYGLTCNPYHGYYFTAHAGVAHPWVGRNFFYSSRGKRHCSK